MRVVAISGSPSAHSRTAMLAEQVLAMLEAGGGSHLRLATLDPAALLAGDATHPSIASATAAVEAADGVIVATPVFKAAYSGLTKAFLDLLPQFALAGKAVLPLATGGSTAHVLALDYALRPVLQFMGARHVVQGVFVANAPVSSDGALALPADVAALLAEAVLHFRHALPGQHYPPLLGHPRPLREMS
ncbi:NADPH-dependent FMN reductase [Pararoseomonas sp. SCSIO 73927]|uniref:NADPH-dependent FMN reductase n=1 Tax=Pararoseomonas sp. SCSIO 73927 TaxID=3114537 RepID=UPI0030CF20A6